jgi:RNA polymerase sigma-70 factor, ECF subfamily
VTNEDKALLEAAHAGDQKALDELLARHEKQVYRFGLRMCGNEEDARDILQETLLAAFRGIGEFRGDARLSTWLFQIARSFCSKSRRLSAGEPAQHEPLDAPEAKELAAEEAAPDARAHAAEIGRVLQAALAVLPAQSREVVVLRDVEGLPAEEAARILGIEVGALKSRLHRARLELRGHLTRLLEEDGPDSAPCPELAQELSAYAGADIDQATCAAVEAHLARCPRCARSCDQLKRTVSLCSALPGGQVPPPVQRAVRQALRAALEKPKPPALEG